jgi:hypothetical protein
MNTDRLIQVARLIVACNAPTAVAYVTLSWDEANSAIHLNFHSDANLSEDDMESCEIALTELYADVWQDIKKMDSSYSSGAQSGQVLPHSQIVYTRR